MGAAIDSRKKQKKSESSRRIRKNVLLKKQNTNDQQHATCTRTMDDLPDGHFLSCLAPRNSFLCTKLPPHRDLAGAGLVCVLTPPVAPIKRP